MLCHRDTNMCYDKDRAEHLDKCQNKCINKSRYNDKLIDKWGWC